MPTIDAARAPTAYTMRVATSLPYQQAIATIREALTEQGFGVLTEIDVRATLSDKLGVDVPPQVILGACQPQLAHQALAAAPSIAALLPCNVTVREVPGGSVVEAVDPEVMSELEIDPAVADVAAEARRRLQAALGRLVPQEA